MRKNVQAFLVIIGTFATYYVANLIAGVLLGTYYELLHGPEVSNEELNSFISQNVHLLLIIASLSALVIFWIAYKVRKKSLIEVLDFRQMEFSSVLQSIFVGSFFSLALFALIALTKVYQLFPSHGDVMESIVPEDGNLFLLFLSVGLVVPIFEEIMHRGIIYTQLKKGAPVPIAILLQAVIFGIFHLNWLQGMYAFVGAIILALLYEYTKSLWAPILMHIGWNTTSLLIPAMYSNIILAGVLIISVVVLFVLLKKLKGNKKVFNKSAWYYREE